MNYEFNDIDVLDGFRQLDDKSVDVVVTSPPYNLNKKYKTYKDNRSRADFLGWTSCWCQEVARVLKPGGSFFLNMGSYSKWPSQPHDVVHAVTTVQKLFVLQNTFHWIKSISIGDESHGHFSPVTSQRYVNNLHEYIFQLTPEGHTRLDRLSIGVPYMDKTNLKRWGHTGGMDLRCRGNVWFIPYRTIQSQNKNRPHPATFPPKLAYNCLMIHHGIDLAVVDPFLGLGNSAIGAFETGKVSEFLGFDLDPFYIEEAYSKYQQSCLSNTNSSPKATSPS